MHSCSIWASARGCGGKVTELRLRLTPKKGLVDVAIIFHFCPSLGVLIPRSQTAVTWILLWNCTESQVDPITMLALSPEANISLVQWEGSGARDTYWGYHEKLPSNLLACLSTSPPQWMMLHTLELHPKSNFISVQISPSLLTWPSSLRDLLPKQFKVHSYYVFPLLPLLSFQSTPSGGKAQLEFSTILELTGPGILNSHWKVHNTKITECHDPIPPSHQRQKKKKKKRIRAMRDVSRSERQVGMGKKNQFCLGDPNQYVFLQLLHIWPSNPLPRKSMSRCPLYYNVYSVHNVHGRWQRVRFRRGVIAQAPKPMHLMWYFSQGSLIRTYHTCLF